MVKKGGAPGKCTPRCGTSLFHSSSSMSAISSVAPVILRATSYGSSKIANVGRTTRDMNASRRVDWFTVVRFATFGCLLFLPRLSPGQSPNMSGTLNCAAADFDVNLQFVNGPRNSYTVVVNRRNISAHPCVFDGPMYGPTFIPDRVPGHAPYGLCYYCDERLPNGETPVIPPLTVNPGQVAHQAFRWRTTSSSEATPCLEPKWMAGPVLLVAPSLLKKVCSDVEVSRFSLLPEATQRESRYDDEVPMFRLTADRALYYEGESFSLRLSRARASAQNAVRADVCPPLFLRQRSPDGETRIDEVQPLAFEGCGKAILGHQPGNWQSGLELDSGANSRWSGVGEHSMEVSQLVGSVDDPEFRFISSTVLRIQVGDPSAIQRKWGPRVKGIAADITLDKGTFRLGEDVPLHLAIKNFDAAVPLYSWDPVWDPCMVVGLEVQDVGGHALSVDKRLPQWSVCTGHGFGPRPVALGKVIPLERTLGKEGWLPNQPGTYTVVITWAPCFYPENDASSGNEPANLKPYAVVHATATLRVVAETDDAGDAYPGRTRRGHNVAKTR
jgi:hypothetical protein